MRTWLLGLLGGLLLASAMPYAPPGAGFAGLLAAAVMGLRTGGRPGVVLSGCLFGLVVGLDHAADQAARRLPLPCVGETLALRGAISGLPEHGQMQDGSPRTRFLLSVEQLEPARCRGPQRVLLTDYSERELAAGQRWQLHARLRRPWAPGNPGLPDRRAWYAAAGIDAQGSVRARPVAQRLDEASGLGANLARLRAAIARHIDEQPLPAATRAVLRALVVGDKSAIGDSLWRSFQQWGIAHLLVISGLHIGLAWTFGYALARAGCLLSRVAVPAALPVSCGLGVATLYAALAGFTVPVQRSLVMLAVFCVALVLLRHSGGWHKLLLAAVVVLLLNPLAAIGAGFWLSFAAVATLLWVATWQVRRPLRSAVYTHVAMGFCMLPLGAYFFQGASLVSPLANLFLVPLVGLWIVPVALSAVLAQLAAPALAPLLWSVAGWPLNQVIALLQRAESGLGTALYVQAAGGAAGLCIGALGVVLALVPGGWRHRLIGLVAIVGSAVPLATPRDARDDVLLFTLLDVGQGIAALVQFGDRALLYDTGGGIPGGHNAARSVVLPLLRKRGIRELDTFVISHGDSDHAAGTADVLDALPVARLRHGPLVSPATGRPCRSGEAWRWPGGVRFRFLSPAVGPVGNSNASSCVLQLTWGEHVLLLAGDIEAAQERALAEYWRDALAADWLLAPHHGSNTSSSHLLLKYVRPAHLLVGNGYVNRFGHPHPAVVERAAAHGARVHETARRGAIGLALHADGTVEWQFYRDLYRPHWAQPLHRVQRSGL